MRDLLDFFEELDELVYVSDIQNHELVYMNRRLRESLGYADHSDYVGQKCYKVLQGREGPCPFCNNGELEQGKFFSWIHKNPVLGKRYLIKDTALTVGQRLCRLELAIDVDGAGGTVPCCYTRSEALLNECLRRLFTATDPEEGLELVLEYLGDTFACDRVYVFEMNGADGVDNTYEWCREGVTPQREILQKVPLSSIDWWLQIFGKNKVVLIRDLEEIRTQYPVAYAILKPQKVRSLAAGPIASEGQIMGFLGVDNPDPEGMALLEYVLNVIGCSVAARLRQRDLLHRLNTLSFHDPLTGVFNRNAMFEHGARCQDLTSVGVVYCDVTSLKQVNDTQGHSAGDQLICSCCNLLKDVLDTPWIYRSGGDEFVAIFRNCSREELKKNVKTLHDRIRQERFHMAVGYAWSDQSPFNLETLIAQADRVMYQDKRDYYEANRGMGVDRRHGDRRGNPEQANSLFYHFLSNTYHDMEFLFRSIAQENAVGYFYFGDLQKDLFYVSDNMRDEFGFESNVVPGLLQEWAQRIPNPKYRQLYQQSLKKLMEEKRAVHDLRYQVRNAAGRNVWIRCYGLLKWSEDGEKPLFFSGRVTHQDDDFMVDPITNFPRGPVMFRYMAERGEEDSKFLTIGFCLNSISELNNTRGRVYSDHLVQSIADELMRTLSGKMSFYRLEGMRCAAVVDPGCQESASELVGQIRRAVEKGYRMLGLSVPNPCSFALMKYPQDHRSPSDYLEDLVCLIKVAKHDPGQPYLDDSASNVEKIRKMSNMALALSQDVLRNMENFRLVIQPVVSADTGRMVSGEALLRWNFGGESVPPDLFIPILERDNLIQKAGRWVFEQAVCSCMRLVACIPDFYLTFNVSLQQLSDTGLTDFMRATLKKYHLDGTHLMAEMTESCMDEQPEKLLHFVDACREMGIQIALDDFGSGYSSLRMLLQYPSNMIKLDRSLLAEMEESADKMSFISSIVYACHQFGKKVCMEGVENKAQDAMIKKAGCDMIQGYYYYKPMEVAEMYRQITQEQPDP